MIYPADSAIHRLNNCGLNFLITFGSKHNSSSLNDKLNTSVMNVASSANQEINIWTHNFEPLACKGSCGTFSLNSSRANPRVRALLIRADIPFPLQICWLAFASLAVVSVCRLIIESCPWFGPSVEIAFFEIKIYAAGRRTYLRSQSIIQLICKFIERFSIECRK